MKIMKIKQFIAIIMKIMKVVEFLCKNHEDHANHKIQREKEKQNETLIISVFFFVF